MVNNSDLRTMITNVPFKHMSFSFMSSLSSLELMIPLLSDDVHPFIPGLVHLKVLYAARSLGQKVTMTFALKVVGVPVKGAAMGAENESECKKRP
jgi:hypothetical protein